MNVFRFCLMSTWLIFATMVSAADRPNVLFIICDDLNCDLGCYGDPQVQSPNIDRLARRGVKFDRAYCQYPLCGPSRASFMTGLYPDQTRIRQNEIALRESLPNVVSMSQHFMNSGYHATRIGKIYHYNVPLHIGTGGHDDPFSWDRTINPEGHDTEIHDKIFSLTPGQFGGTLSWLADDASDEEQTDGIAASEADEMLSRYAKSKRPFFLAVGLYRPHTPYVSPKAYFAKYPLDSIEVPTIPEGYFDTLPKPAVQTIRDKRDQLQLTAELGKQAIQAYHASISFADAQIGRIMDSLDRHALAENTIVVFTSDHGYHMGQHGHWQKRTLFENGTRVPLIMAGPGIVKNETAASLAEMVDFYPTLCSLARLPIPGFVSGTDLSPALKDPAVMTRQEALTQHLTGYALRTDRYRIVRWGGGGVDGFELYDHQNDPAEMTNLASDPKHAELLKSLQDRLDQRIQSATAKPKGLTQVTPYENSRPLAIKKVGPKASPKKSLLKKTPVR
jgi:iduronate 2-sulfatase